VTDVLSESAAAAWLEVLGALMGGVAHRSNNILNAATVNAQVLVSRLAPGSVPAGMSGADLSARTFAFAEKTSVALQSTTELVHSMLALARPLSVPADPVRMVDDIVRVVAADADTAGPRLAISVQDAVLPPEAGAVVRLAIASGARVLQCGERGGTVRWVGREVSLTRPNGDAGEVPILGDDIVRILIEAGFAVQARTDVVTFSIPV
jgi:signal transduction histidine kinase